MSLLLLLGCGGAPLVFSDYEVAATSFCGAPASPSHSRLRWVGERQTTLSLQIDQGRRALAGGSLFANLYTEGELPVDQYEVQLDSEGRLELDTAALPETDAVWAFVFTRAWDSDEALGELWLEPLEDAGPTILCAGHINDQGQLGEPTALADGATFELWAFTHDAAGLDLTLAIEGQAEGSPISVELGSATGEVSASEEVGGWVSLSVPSGADLEQVAVSGKASLWDGGSLVSELGFVPNVE
ncbi:MAG: hypothetical protein VX899_24600 [Myxococcota bacterium]|nr:hypothetical protein [Myxococcota bacterium]